MYDLLSNPDPAVREEILRRRQQQEALAQASQQGNRYNTLAAVAQMANNPAAAKASALAQTMAQKQHAPVQMGQQGFTLPASGEFVSSPMYEDEKNAGRQQQRDLARERQDLLREQQAARAQSQADLQAQRLEAQKERDAANRQAAAERAAQANALRMTLAGMTQGGKQNAAQAKLDAATEKQMRAREGVSETLTLLSQDYNELAKNEGIPDTKAGVFKNALARASASGPGQLLGQTLGTKNQSIRNRVAAKRPMLLTDIMQATGLKATQINSNVELQFYLAAATDPARDIQSNLAAIDYLDRKFGLGKGVVGAPPAAQQALDQEFKAAVTPPAPPPGLKIPPGYKYVGPAQ